MWNKQRSPRRQNHSKVQPNSASLVGGRRGWILSLQQWGNHLAVVSNGRGSFQELALVWKTCKHWGINSICFSISAILALMELVQYWHIDWGQQNLRNLRFWRLTPFPVNRGSCEPWWTVPFFRCVRLTESSTSFNSGPQALTSKLKHWEIWGTLSLTIPPDPPPPRVRCVALRRVTHRSYLRLRILITGFTSCLYPREQHPPPQGTHCQQ